MRNKTLPLSVFCLTLLVLAACSVGKSTPIATAQPMVSTSPTAKSMVAAPTQTPTAAVALPSYNPVAIVGNYQFAEGPAVEADGNVYFSDINAGKIYKWATDGSVAVFVEGLNKPNGLAFDQNGNLIACEGGNGRLIAIDSRKQITVLADQYQGARFNAPNDLWIDPQGGIYFTDPAYQTAVVQDGEHVYYLSPDHRQVRRVIADLVRPNGIVGTTDGKTLYVADHGAGQTFAYTIHSDGSLSDKRLFVATGSDGMDLDQSGNLYLTVPNQVEIFDTNGKHLQDIPLAETPTNVAFAGTDHQTLFITARTAVYIASGSNESAVSNAITGFTLTSPDLPPDNRLPIEYTCDGAASTLALNWSGAPEDTISFAIIMHHVAGLDDVHWYWVLYNLPANVTSLSKNVAGSGTLGTNSVNDRTEYAPPCSKGPGDKEYIYTVYALSAEPHITVAANKVSRAVLLDAIQDITLASAELHVIYARP